MGPQWGKARATCPTCNEVLAASYCPECGERALHPHDLTLRGLLKQVVQTFTSVDGPLLRSFRCLVTRPGVLTVAYLRGQRKPYTLPLQLFLVANVLFFAMQSFTGAKLFSTPLNQHLQSDIWGDVAQQLVGRRLEMRQTSMDLYAPVFDHAVEVNAKSLIAVMVLPFALLPAVVFYRSRRPFVAHIVFSLHFYTFLLLLLMPLVSRSWDRPVVRRPRIGLGEFRSCVVHFRTGGVRGLFVHRSQSGVRRSRLGPDDHASSSGRCCSGNLSGLSLRAVADHSLQHVSSVIMGPGKSSSARPIRLRIVGKKLKLS